MKIDLSNQEISYIRSALNSYIAKIMRLKKTKASEKIMENYKKLYHFFEKIKL